MEFVDVTNQKRQRSDSEETLLPVYYENVMRQVSFNPATLVLALAVYVFLFIVGILTNSRALSVIRRHVRRNPFAFDIRLVEVDVLSLCCTNLISILCCMFVIFDLVYGQWMQPSKMLCRLYLSAEAFTKVASGMTLLHLVFVCTYFVRKTRDTAETSFPSGPISKIFLHCCYVLVLCPAFALTLSIVLFQQGDVRFSKTEIPTIDVDNNTDTITVEKCGLTMTNKAATSLTIYSSICAYLAPAAAFISGAILCRCRCKNLSDLALRRYCNMATNYGVWFFLCHTPAWAMSVYDYFVNISLVRDKSQDAYFEHTIAFVSYFAHTISYFTCVGYPVLYLRGLSVNRVSYDISGDSLAVVTRDETAVSLTSAQRVSGRDMSHDVLLANRRPMRSRTTSMLQVTNLDATVSVAVGRYSSYQTLANQREEEDRV